MIAGGLAAGLAAVVRVVVGSTVSGLAEATSASAINLAAEFSTSWWD